MIDSKKLGVNSTCVHIGEVKDEQFKGAISPMYMSTTRVALLVVLVVLDAQLGRGHTPVLCR